MKSSNTSTQTSNLRLVYQADNLALDSANKVDCLKLFFDTLAKNGSTTPLLDMVNDYLAVLQKSLSEIRQNLGAALGIDRTDPERWTVLDKETFDQFWQFRLEERAKEAVEGAFKKHAE